ncbi:transposase [Acinetobacter qingfengensis]|uniref:Transposase n=2 Tax=Acinetobacter qingfengensis TaxID=1262585 RepID=A0A1E7QYR9_9GAMM|nr:transposase [Acinetobacter qingfengensis]
MAKYSQEFKLEVVQYYLSGFGKVSTGNKYNVHPNDVVKWVAVFQQHGVSGLNRKNKKSIFTIEFKYRVVTTILFEGLSLTEAIQRFQIRETSIIRSWLRQYQENGIDGLKPKPKGRSKHMSKPKLPKTSKTDQDKTQKELLEELAYLRAENAFLKKLRALRLEQEAQEQAEQQKLQDLYQD